ncbi:MAG TPA: isochorismatase family protein [Stellaceae bacterium]|nr:isochorismatase family protein [Stellaceae bacterium]
MKEMLLSSLALAIGATSAAAQSGTPTGGPPMMSVQMPAPPAPVAVSLKPATTALFVSDVIEPICSRQPKCVESMVPKIAGLIARARKAGMLVAYSTQEANMEKWMPAVKPAAGDPLIPSKGQDRFFSTELDNVLKAKGITTIILTGWKVSGSLLYTSVGATLRGYTVVAPTDTTSAPTDYEIPIGIYAILNQNAANPTNEALKPRTSTLSRSDLISFQ